MTKVDRRFFLRQLSVLTTGFIVLPKWLRGETNPLDFKIHDLSVIDLHCHPSLKMYLWGRDMRRHHHPGKGDNTFNQQIDIHTLESGYIKGMLATHYLVEASVETEWSNLKAAFWGIKNLFPKLQDKVEHGDYSNFTQINIMIDILETQVHLTNQYLKFEKLVIARNFQEFQTAIQEGKIPIAHSIEGAHALGRDKQLGLRDNSSYKPIDGKMQDSKDDATKYIQNLEALKMRGVCLIAISHLFENDIAYPCEGIAVNEKHSLRMDWHFDPATNDLPLKPVGKAVVEKMLELGIIVDLTHSTPATRRQVFKINKARGDNKRPLTFTHVGSREMFDAYDSKYNNGANKNFGYYSINKEEVKEICDCDGVIGVVFENFWLTGCNRHIDKKEKKMFSEVIPFIVETMVQINSYTTSKAFDNVAIGSDFDGLADAETDLYNPSQLKELVAGMKNYNHPNSPFTDKVIRKIFHENAMRLLQNGWL